MSRSASTCGEPVRQSRYRGRRTDRDDLDDSCRIWGTYGTRGSPLIELWPKLYPKQEQTTRRQRGPRPRSRGISSGRCLARLGSRRRTSPRWSSAPQPGPRDSRRALHRASGTGLCGSIPFVARPAHQHRPQMRGESRDPCSGARRLEMRIVRARADDVRARLYSHSTMMLQNAIPNNGNVIVKAFNGSMMRPSSPSQDFLSGVGFDLRHPFTVQRRTPPGDSLHTPDD